MNKMLEELDEKLKLTTELFDLPDVHASTTSVPRHHLGLGTPDPLRQSTAAVPQAHLTLGTPDPLRESISGAPQDHLQLSTPGPLRQSFHFDNPRHHLNLSTPDPLKSSAAAFGAPTPTPTLVDPAALRAVTVKPLAASQRLVEFDAPHRERGLNLGVQHLSRSSPNPLLRNRSEFALNTMTQRSSPHCHGR